MPDPDNKHRAATKVEAKMQEMLKNSLNKGLKPLEQEVIDGQNRQVNAARALLNASQSDIQRMLDKWKNAANKKNE